MIGFRKKARSTPVACKQQGASRLFRHLFSGSGQELSQFTIGCFPVSYMELNGLAGPNVIANRNGSFVRVHSNDVSNEKVPLIEMFPILGDNTSHMQSATNLLLLARRQRLKHFHKPLVGWSAAKLVNHVP